MAGGSSRSAAGEWATIWTSVDGRAWSEPMTIGPQPDEHTRYLVSGFALWDGDLLAMGWRGTVGTDSGSPMLWRTSDGATWDEVDFAGTAYDTWQHGRESGLTAGGSLAVVSMTGLGPGAAAFVTPDLETWEEHAIVDWSTDIAVNGLAAAPDLLMVVGVGQHPYDEGEEPTFTQHAWISADAVTWVAIEPPDEQGMLADVAWDAERGRFVVVGTDERGLPHAWLTTDGAGWSAIPLGTSAATMHSVSANNGLIVATGVSGPRFEPETGETIAWSSYDAVTWWYEPVLDGQGQTLVSSMPTSAVLIANRSSPSGGETWLSLAGAAESAGE
jgi:hypothetical protein